MHITKVQDHIIHMPETNTQLPTPEQLFELAKAGKSLARSHSRQGWRQSQNSKLVHFFLPKPVFENHSDEAGFRYSEYKFAGRVAFHDNQWTMRISESYWVRGDDGDEAYGSNQDGYRTTYKFAWNRSKTTAAARNIHAMFIPLSEELHQTTPVVAGRNLDEATELETKLRRSYAIEKVSKLIVDPRSTMAAAEMRTVTAGDCEQLIGTIDSFSEI